MSIRLPSLPVSNFYSHNVVWIVFILNFGVVTDLMLYKLKIFDLTTSKPLADTPPFQCLGMFHGLLYTSLFSWHLSWSITTHLFKLISSPTLCTAPPICQASAGLLHNSTVFTVSLGSVFLDFFVLFGLFTLSYWILYFLCCM